MKNLSKKAAFSMLLAMLLVLTFNQKASAGYYPNNYQNGLLYGFADSIRITTAGINLALANSFGIQYRPCAIGCGSQFVNNQNGFGNYGNGNGNGYGQYGNYNNLNYGSNFVFANNSFGLGLGVNYSNTSNSACMFYGYC